MPFYPKFHEKKTRFYWANYTFEKILKKFCLRNFPIFNFHFSFWKKTFLNIFYFFLTKKFHNFNIFFCFRGEKKYILPKIPTKVPGRAGVKMRSKINSKFFCGKNFDNVVFLIIFEIFWEILIYLEFYFEIKISSKNFFWKFQLFGHFYSKTSIFFWKSCFSQNFFSGFLFPEN